MNIGLLINPYAGIGGSVALKGSDGAEVRAEALRRGAALRAEQRARRALQVLIDAAAPQTFVCWGGPMGADLLADLGCNFEVLGTPASPSSADDTRAAAVSIAASKPDILLFVGGDGTARDVLDAVGESVCVLGIPSGVKMHSGVYAVSPEAGGELLVLLASAGLVSVQLREVRDIDEHAFREGKVKTRFYGELLTPEEGHYLQHTKIAGVESQELAAADIAADVVESMSAGCLYILGPGSTLAAVSAELGLPATLLGVDVVKDGQLVCADAAESDLLALLADHGGTAAIVVTAIGGQGHIFGRGNQQLSPQVIRAVGLEQVQVVATKAKISALQGRPLLADTNDAELDQSLAGYRRVVTGYHDAVLYPVGLCSLKA